MSIMDSEQELNAAEQTDMVTVCCAGCGNSDLFHGHDEYFCLFCGFHICPICGRGADAPTRETCEHFLTAAVCGEYSEDEEWKGLYSLEELGPASFRDSEWQEQYVWPEGVWESASATVTAMSEEEKAQRFGPLHSILHSSGCVHVSEACALLGIPVCSTYTDGSAFIDMYYTEIGNEKAWRMLRPAIEQYRQGLTWLERFAREWE